jgi:hypothetical protein
MQTFPKTSEIAEGSLFRRVISGSMAEIAEVVEVGRDRMGIPHVRFNTHLIRGSYGVLNPEQRTLALESFCARYKERVRINEKSNRVEAAQ